MLHNETRFCDVDNLAVARYRIIGTDIVCYRAHEPCQGHSAFTSFDGRPGFWGTIPSRPLPPGIDGMRDLEERYHAVRTFHAANVSESMKIIRSLFPESRAGHPDGMGGIELTDPRL